MSLLGKDWNDPKTLATLQMAAGLLGGGNFGQAAARGLTGYQDTMKAASAADLAKEERDYLKSEREREKAKRDATQAWRAGLPDAIKRTTQPTYGAGDEGPTMTPADPSALMSYASLPASPFADEIMKQQLVPDAGDYKVVGTDLVKIGRGGVSVAHSAPRTDKLPSEQVLYNLAVSQGYKGDYLSFMRDRVASTEGAKASFDVMPVTSPDGTTSMLPRSTVAARAGGGAVRPSGSFQGSGYNGGSANAAATEQREILNRELAKAQREGRAADVEGLQRELGRLPGGGGFPVQSPAQAAAATAAATDAATGKLAERERAKSTSLASIESQIGVIDKALSHPGRGTATGLSGTIDPRNYIPGTNARDFRVVADQLGGAAFLQAFESLKGGGAITEVEGKKATDAIARLNRAQSDQEYGVALQELRTVMDNGRKRLGGTDKPGGGAALPLPPNPTAASLTKGVVYETSRGNATWDGMKFNLVK